MLRWFSRFRAFLSGWVGEPLFGERVRGAAGRSDGTGPGRQVIWLTFAALSLLYVYAACIDLGFSADGAYFFMRALDDRKTLVPEPSRLFASLIQMWPVTTAARLGLTSLPVLKGLFHLALYLPFLVSFLICWRVVRDLDDDALMIFPLASQLLVSLPAASILAGQSHVLAVAVWPILFLALKPRHTWLEGALLLLLLVLMTRLYEASASPALVLFGVLALRVLIGGNGSPRLLFGLASLLALATPLWAVYSTFSDFTARSQGDFVAALSTPILRYPRLHPMLSLSGGALLLLAVAVFARGRMAQALLAGAAVLGALSVAVTAHGMTVDANTSFNMRALTFTLLPMLMAMAVCWHWRRRILPRSIWLGGGLVMVLLTSGYALSWSSWADYRAAFRAELDSHTGYVDIESTSVARHPQRWRWTPSVLSILWSGPCVRTMLWTEGNTEWPIRLRGQFPMRDYVAYDSSLTGSAAAQCGH